MALFTFIMDYRGGTYISQVNANSLNKAKEKWVMQIKVTEVKDLGDKTMKQLVEELLEDDSVLIDGLKNIWHNLYLVKGGYITVHIIKTLK